jgi:NAD(P)-dependent dehydrogenase (short-subunit alcohol dehydrogenase family)
VLVDNAGIFEAVPVFHILDAPLRTAYGRTRVGTGDFREQRIRRADSGADVPFAVAEGRPTSLIQRLIRPAEIANLITHVASEFSSATTGGALRVDGGVATSIVS